MMRCPRWSSASVTVVGSRVLRWRWGFREPRPRLGKIRPSKGYPPGSPPERFYHAARRLRHEPGSHREHRGSRACSSLKEDFQGATALSVSIRQALFRWLLLDPVAALCNGRTPRPATPPESTSLSRRAPSRV